MKTLIAVIAITLTAVYLTVGPIFETIATEIAQLCQILGGL